MRSAAPFASLKILKLCVGIVTACYLLNFLVLGFLMSPFDYDHMSGYYEIAWRYWRHSTGLPHFNPLLCGGRPLAADPQIPLFNPALFLVPFLGAVWTIKIEQLFQLGLGLWGLIGVLRRFNLPEEEGWWGALCYLCGGAIVSRFLVGHVAVGFYLMVPLFFHLSYQLHEGKVTSGWLLRYWLLFWYAYLHKPNFPIYVIPTLLIETAIRSLLARKVKPIIHLVIACCVGALLNLPSYLTANDYFALYPRIADGIPNSTPIYTLILNILFPLKSLPEFFYGPHYFGRHEYSQFLGAVPLLFAAVGMRRLFREPALGSFRPHLIALLIWSLFSIGVGLGTDSPRLSLAPYSWLNSFWPGFQSVRAPMRFWYGAFLTLIIFSTFGMRMRLPGPPRFWVIIALVPLLTHVLINLSKTTLLGLTPRTQAFYTQNFEWASDNVSGSYSTIRQGLGTLDCFFNMEIPKAGLQSGKLLPTVPGIDLHWTNWNRIHVDSDTPGRNTLKLNLNHAPYWHFEGTGATIQSHDGDPLTLALSRGPLNGELYYEIPRLKWSLWIAIASLAIAMGVLLSGLVYTRK